MSGGNEHPWLAAVREEARYLVIRRVLKLAAASMTVTIHLYRAGLIGSSGAKAGLRLAGKLQRTAIRGYGQAGSGTDINIWETN